MTEGEVRKTSTRLADAYADAAREGGHSAASGRIDDAEMTNVINFVLNHSCSDTNDTLLKHLAVLVLRRSTQVRIMDALLACSYMAAFATGQVQGQQYVLAVLGPHATRGRKSMLSAKQGHAVIHGTREQKEARWAQYQTDVNAYHIRFPALSHLDLCDRVANDHGVHRDTVRKHTTNPNKPK